jgi:hypothetical protein
MSENNESLTITVNALVRKRADIVFEIERGERRLEELRAELIHLDAVLRMLRPDLSTDALPGRKRKRVASPYFGRGELTKRIYDALREARGKPVNGADIAVRAMLDKGLNPEADKATRRDFVRRVNMQLNNLAQKGKINRNGKARALRWRLNP